MIEGDEVFRLVGDPLDKPTRGERVGALKDVKLLAPCVPRKIPAVAINFPGIDRFDPNMKEPLVLLKAGTSVCGPGDPVVNPFPELRWWGEAELAVVIKREMRNVPEESVRDYVLGFTIGNDASVENV